jgi:AbrB family looped-hinge helix DNA binding protein
MKSKVTEKGQVTIPKPLRESLGIKAGQELDFEEHEGALVARRVVPADPLRKLVGLIEEPVDVDAYLAETRGPAWDEELDRE